MTKTHTKTKPPYDEDKEVKTEKVISVNVLKMETNKMVDDRPSWYRLKRLVTWFILTKDKLKTNAKDDKDK